MIAEARGSPQVRVAPKMANDLAPKWNNYHFLLLVLLSVFPNAEGDTEPT